MLPVRWCVSGLRCDCVCLTGRELSPSGVCVVPGWCWGVSPSGVCVVLGWCWGVSPSGVGVVPGWCWVSPRQVCASCPVGVGCLPVRCVCCARVVLGVSVSCSTSERPASPRALRPSARRFSSCACGFSWSVACGSRSLTGDTPTPCFERAGFHQWTAAMALGSVF